MASAKLFDCLKKFDPVNVFGQIGQQLGSMYEVHLEQDGLV